MKTKKALLVAVLSLPLLAACKKTSTFKITFHQDEGNKDDVIEVVVGKTTAEDVKTFQNNITLNQKDYYTVKWADYDFSKITSDYVVNAIYTPIDYTITYKNGSDVVGAVTYTVESKEEEVKAKEPAVPTKQGYTYKWEDYTIKGKHENFEVKAIESINEYTITYKNGETVLGTTKYTCVMTDDQVKAKQPKLPDPKEGYSIKYEDYTIVGKYSDFTVNTVETANTYYATFVDKDGKQVGDKVPFTVESKKITEPAVPTRDHYTGKWEEYTLIAKDITIKPEYTAITYHATFKDGETTVATLDFSIESTSITAPEISSEEHYTSIQWSDGTSQYDGGATIDMKSSLKDTTFNKVRVGEKHTITLKVNGGTMPENADSTVDVEYGKEYVLPTPTFKSGVATFMGWYDTTTGEKVESTGKSAFTSDVTLIARYMGDLETEAGKGVVISGTRGGTIKTWELTDEDKTQGSKCLKLTSKGSDESGQSTTVGCSFDSDFLTSAFADTNVKAVNFDLKASAPLTKLSYGNSTKAPYEYDCCTSDKPGFGGQTFWKTFSLTREMYTAASDKGLLICTVGGQLPNGGNIWIDNIRPSSTTVNLLSFEGGRMVPKDDSSSHYKKSVSFRDFNDEEIFTITTGYADAINFGFDFQYKTEGLKSIHYEHKANTNVWLTLPRIDLTKVKEVSFDICLSKAFNGNTVRDGNGNELFSSGKVYQAYEWVTFTVPVEKISSAKQFCTVTSSLECDFYVDNIKIVLNE